jgi:hypothetical protein
VFFLLIHINSLIQIILYSWSSAASVVSDYRLDDRATGVRSPEEANNFFPKPLSRPGLRPTLPPIQWVPVVPFRGGKVRPGRDADHSPHLVPRSRISRSYTSSSHIACMVVLGQLYVYSEGHYCLYSSRNIYEVG